MLDLKKLHKMLLGLSGARILTHKSPDGDCIGAGLALCYWLRAKGIPANLLNSDGIPNRYSFIAEGYSPVELPGDSASISVDLSDTSLLGDSLEEYAGDIYLSGDHHASNRMFAKNNFVDGSMSAACLIVYEMLSSAGEEIDSLVASCLYTGIATDTGCFRFENTTPEAHTAAAGLMRLGVDYAGINRLMFDVRSKGRLIAEQRVISGMELFGDGRIAVITVTNGMIEELNIDRTELEGLASIPLCVEGARVGITLKQLEGEHEGYKVSIRTIDIDASLIASRFGGGGHIRAAGCQIEKSREEAVRLLVREASALL